MWSWWRFDPHHFALAIGVVVQVLEDGNEIVKIVFSKTPEKNHNKHWWSEIFKECQQNNVSNLISNKDELLVSNHTHRLT